MENDSSVFAAITAFAAFAAIAAFAALSPPCRCLVAAFAAVGAFDAVASESLWALEGWPHGVHVRIR